MKHETQVICPDRMEFYFPDLDNHVLVENCEGTTTIRATRDNFSEKRKVFFVRRLALEGQIPDRYQWFPEPNSGDFLRVSWVIDRSWVGIDPDVRRRAARNVLRLVLFSVLIWALLLFSLLVTYRR
jgi:hypothetical protein